MQRYLVDFDRACDVFDKLTLQLKELRHPFDHSHPPQKNDNMPKNLKRGGREHAFFFVVACYYMRGGIDSEVAVRQLTLIHEGWPELFDPTWITENLRPSGIVDGRVRYKKNLHQILSRYKSYRLLRSLLKAHGLGFSLRENTRFWLLNAVKIHEHWDNNPLRFFEGVTAYDVLLERIQNFGNWRVDDPNGLLGFQEKMVSMIAYFLGAEGLIDRHKIPVPVDFHVLRLLIAHEIITPGFEARLEDNIFNSELLSVARDVTERYCVERGLDMVELCDALWLFSRSMCSWHPDNESKTPDKSEKRKEQLKLRKNRKEIPEGKEYKKRKEKKEGENYSGRRSRVIHIPPTWNKSQLQAFDRSCRMCPIRETCKFGIASAPYYLSGQLNRRIRTEPPAFLTILRMEEVAIRVVNLPWAKEASRQLALQSFGKIPNEGQLSLKLG